MMKMNLSISTQDIAQTCIPHPWRNLSLSPNAVQSPTPLIPLPQCSPVPCAIDPLFPMQSRDSSQGRDQRGSSLPNTNKVVLIIPEYNPLKVLYNRSISTDSKYSPTMVQATTTARQDIPTWVVVEILDSVLERPAICPTTIVMMVLFVIMEVV